jgi:hypothetical protein
MKNGQPKKADHLHTKRFLALQLPIYFNYQGNTAIKKTVSLAKIQN